MATSLYIWHNEKNGTHIWSFWNTIKMFIVHWWIVSCSNTAWICQEMVLNKRNLFIVVISRTAADRNGSDISVRFITGPHYSLDLQHSHQRCLLWSQFHPESCHFMLSKWKKKVGNTIYQHNRHWHRETPREFFITAIHPTPILLTSCCHCAEVHYITIMFPRCTPKGLFLLPAHSFFHGLGLLIKMLNATLEVTNTKFCCLTFSFSRYTTQAWRLDEWMMYYPRW